MPPHNVALRSTHTRMTLACRIQSMLTTQIMGAESKAHLLISILLLYSHWLKTFRSPETLSLPLLNSTTDHFLSICMVHERASLCTQSSSCCGYKGFIPHCLGKNSGPSTSPFSQDGPTSVFSERFGQFYFLPHPVGMRIGSQTLAQHCLYTSGLSASGAPRRLLPPSNCFLSMWGWVHHLFFLSLKIKREQGPIWIHISSSGIPAQHPPCSDTIPSSSYSQRTRTTWGPVNMVQ